MEEVALDTYLAQVVLSEMPASFAPEALKAQAVAARTFACRQTAGGKHENADVCAQSACCQACLTVEDLRQVVFPHPTVSEVIREAAWAVKL